MSRTYRIPPAKTPCVDCQESIPTVASPGIEHYAYTYVRADAWHVACVCGQWSHPDPFPTWLAAHQAAQAHVRAVGSTDCPCQRITEEAT